MRVLRLLAPNSEMGRLCSLTNEALSECGAGLDPPERHQKKTVRRIFEGFWITYERRKGWAPDPRTWNLRLTIIPRAAFRRKADLPTQARLPA